MKTDYLFKFFLPGLSCVLIAFWMGSQENVFFAFVGFLAFFVIGITLIVEGRKKATLKKDDLEEPNSYK